MAVIDSYSETNRDSDSQQYNGGNAYWGQSFTGDGSTIDDVRFYLRKTGSPTGNVFAYIYASTGSHGTTAKPTGSPLATSDALDISTLTTSNVLTTINFSGANRIVLTAATIYEVVIRYSGGDFSNRLGSGIDSSTLAHAGNAAYSTDGSTWSADPGFDMCFYVDGSASAGLAITTNAATNVFATRATGNGNITNVTSGNADERGIVYSTSTQSAPGNVAPGSSGYSGVSNSTGSFGTGAFTQSLTGLSPLTRYYARAYAHNSTDGYIYGSEVNFITGLEVAWFRA